MDFVEPADHRVKLKENEKKNNTLTLLENWKNIKVTLIPIVIGALSTVTKWLVQGLEDLKITWEEETIQTTALLRLIIILRRVLETWGDLGRLAVTQTNGKTSAKYWQHKDQRNDNNQKTKMWRKTTLLTF